VHDPSPQLVGSAPQVLDPSPPLVASVPQVLDGSPRPLAPPSQARDPSPQVLAPPPQPAVAAGQRAGMSRGRRAAPSKLDIVSATLV
jgi:hypothetical protein